MTVLGYILLILLVVLAAIAIVFLYKYHTSLFNPKYSLFFMIFGAAVISILFLIPKTSSRLIISESINILEQQNTIEGNKKQFEEYTQLLEKERIKTIKKELKKLKKEIKKNPNDEKQQKYIEIQNEMKSIPNLKKEMKSLKKQIRKLSGKLKVNMFSMFFKSNYFIIFVCFASLIFILFILYIIGTIKKTIMIEAYNERKKVEAERLKEKKRQEKIREIANFLYVNNLKFLDVRNAYLLVNDYEKNTSSSLINTMFSLIDNGERSLSTQNNYRQAKSLISALPDKTCEYCDKYGAEIINCINEIHNTKIEKQKAIKLEEERKQKETILEQQHQQELSKQSAMEQVAKQTEIREKEVKRKREEDKVSHTVEHIEDSIPRLLNHVSNNGSMDFILLNNLMKDLETIQNLKNNIPSNCMNKIRNSQILLNTVFEKCTNREDIETYEKIIKSTFEKILNE